MKPTIDFTYNEMKDEITFCGNSYVRSHLAEDRRHLLHACDHKDSLIEILEKEIAELKETIGLRVMQNLEHLSSKLSGKPITSTAHSSLLIHDVSPELLVGKWVKAKRDGLMNPGGEQFCKEGNWYPIISFTNDGYIIETDHRPNHYWGKTGSINIYFDLSDPRDSKPVEEVRIPFDIERWRKNDFIRVETRSGRTVTQLTDFGTNKWPLVGIIDGCDKSDSWVIDGRYEYVVSQTEKDLTLIVKQ